jgi:hypothetical protein
VRKQLRVEKRASIFLINRNLQETAQWERVNCQRPGHRAANSVCSLSRRGEGWGEGGPDLSRDFNPSPPSLWERVPTEFAATVVIAGLDSASIVFAKCFSKNDGPAGQARG